MKLRVLSSVLSFVLMFSLAYSQGRSKKDGKYHDPVTNAVQPDHCDNEGPHPCKCARTTMDCNDKEVAAMEPGPKCSTYCRKNDCRCKTCCDDQKG